MKDDATFVDALSMVDKQISEHQENSPFKEHGYLRSYLQIFWNPEENKIYEDIHAFAVGNRGSIMPITRDINYNLHDNCEIALSAVMCD